LAGRHGLEDVFAAVNMPQVKIASVRSPDASGSKSTQGHSVPRTII